jgi:hypothetical protein
MPYRLATSTEYEDEGFEPPRDLPIDLQSTALTILPRLFKIILLVGIEPTSHFRRIEF